MPDKEESYLSGSNVICTPSYQNLTLPSESLLSECKKEMPLSSQIQDRTVPSCHTAFPVDLKEVFELTNPNTEIHQPILRSSESLGSMQYSNSSEIMHSPKDVHSETSENEVPWRHVLREQSSHSGDFEEGTQLIHSVKEHSSEEQNSWEDAMDESEGLDDETEILHTCKSSQIAVISTTEVWTHVIKQTSSSDKPLLHSTNKEHMISGNDHGSWNHVLEEIPNSRGVTHAPQLIHNHPEIAHNMSNSKTWSRLLTDQHQEEENAPPIDLSGDCPNLTSLIPDRRDVSCQVNDVTSIENDLNGSPISKGDCRESSSKHVSSEDDAPQSMLNLTMDSEGVKRSAEAVVHNGVKPELYTQERHLVVQAGTKAQGTTKINCSYSCNHCGKLFGDSRSLQRHMLIHIGLRPYRCPVCGKAFMLNGDLTRHIRIHSGERPYACDICGRRFTLKGNLMQHFRTHTPEKQYACTICEKNYAQKDSLHRHIRAHFGEKPFECTTCSKRFTLKGDLSRHILIHSGVKPHFCKYCGRQFALKGNLTQHVRTHVRTQSKSSENSNVSFNSKAQVEPQLICDFSPKTFVSMPNGASNKVVTSPQTTSLSNVHPYVQTSSPPETNHQSTSVGLSFCSECSKTFPSPESLHEHVQLIHEQSTRLASNRYLCNICQKEFCLKGDLTRHLNSHNGVKPYECEHCSKTFTLKSNLRQHMTTHRMDKSYACPMCSKSFGNRRNLGLHLRRHELARANFTCTKCGRSFLAKSDHFFHDCVKEETSAPTEEPSSTTASIVVSTSPPHSPTSVAEDNQVSILPVKRESYHIPCGNGEMDDPIECNISNLSSVNGAQGFLGPFYRHLYISTSHQAMIPTLKGLFHASSSDSAVAEINRVGKTS